MRIRPFLLTLAAAIPFIVSLFFPDGIHSYIWRIILLFIFLVINYIINAFSNTTLYIERSQNHLSDKILDEEKELAEYRRNIIEEILKKVIYNHEPYENLNYDPEDKLYFILERLRSTIKNYMEIDGENISTTIFYHYDFQEETEWTRLGQNYFNAYEDDKSVIFDANSFGKYVLNSPLDFHFLNDKFKEGVEKGIYKLNDKDVETKKKYNKYGSIVGLKFGIKVRDKEPISVLLTISTYGKQIDNVLLKTFRERIEEKLKKIILPIYQINIESELMQLYLREIKAKYPNEKNDCTTTE